MPLRRHSRIASHQSKRFIEKRQRRLLIGVGLFLICAASWTFALSRVSYLEYFSIESVQIYGADADIAPAVQSAAYDAIQGSFLGLFSKSNSFIYPRKALTAVAIGASSRIISVGISREGYQTLAVSVTEKTPTALVCPDLPNFDRNGALSADDDCYAADASGFIFKKMPAKSGEAIIRYYEPDLPDASIIGLYATSTAEFKALQSFTAGARSAGLEPEAVLMKDAGEYELYADSPASSFAGAASAPLIVVYFNDKAGLPAELSDLSAFWPHMAASSAAAGAPLDLEYIDLRYGSNVFYR